MQTSFPQITIYIAFWEKSRELSLLGTTVIYYFGSVSKFRCFTQVPGAKKLTFNVPIVTIVIFNANFLFVDILNLYCK